MERKLLTKLIDNFLAERRESDGGWAPVTEQDLDQLHSIIDTITNMKWGEDTDGDLPIEWKIIDRTRFERMHYAPVPYEHDAERDHFNIVMMNAQIAIAALDVTLKIQRLNLREKPKK